MTELTLVGFIAVCLLLSNSVNGQLFNSTTEVNSNSSTRVRLVGGYYQWEGRVEVYHNGEWGTVCDDSFDTQDAKVICVMLGYHRNGIITAYQNARFGTGSGSIMLDDLNCNGNEFDISQCSSGGWKNHNCGHDEDASISCQYPKSHEETTTDDHITTSQYGLQGSQGQTTPVRLTGGVYPWEGRVQVYHNGQWGTICDDRFDVSDARVICAMLGYNRFGSVTAYSNARFGSGSGQIMIDELQCSGNERDISECQSNTWYSNDCSHSEDAAVSCKYPKSEEVTTNYPDYTSYHEITTSSSMLGSNGHIPIDLSNGNRGFLLVNAGGRWGYVCYDHYIPSYQMNSVCSYLGFSGATSVSLSYTTNTAILSNLHCDSYYYGNGIDYCRGDQLGVLNYCRNKIYIVCSSDSLSTTEEPMTTAFTSGCQGISYNPADIVFVVDASGNVGEINFNLTKESIVEAIKQLDVRNDMVRVGLVTFSDDNFRDVFYLSSYIGRQYNMESHVLEATYLAGGTDVGRALHHTCHDIFQQSYGDRSNAENYLFLLTGGHTNAQQAADDCKARGIKIISLGIGDSVNEHALRNISYTSDYYVTVNFTDIDEDLPRVVTTVINCEPPEKTDEHYIHVNCEHSHWNIEVHIPPLEQKYAGFNDGDVYLGHHSCTGHRSGNYLIFNEDYTTCGTLKEVSANGLVYKNTLIYAVHDPYQPFIVHEYKFKVNVKCDMTDVGAQINNNGVTVPEVVGAGHFPVQLKFYSDSNYQHEVLNFPPLHMVGQNLYVIAQTPIHDYDVKMRLKDCYTKPSQYASDSYTYYIIKNGCPAEPNAFVTSTRTHETRFYFQDFEYAFQPNSMYIHCNATFCHVNDYTVSCEPRCHTADVQDDEPIDEGQSDGPVGYGEDDAVLNLQYDSNSEALTGNGPEVEYKRGKPLYVAIAVVTGVTMVTILVGFSLSLRSRRNRPSETKTV